MIYNEQVKPKREEDPKTGIKINKKIIYNMDE